MSKLIREEKFENARSKVKKIGLIIMAIGICMILVGAFVVNVPDMSAEGWFESKSLQMFLVFPGIFLTIVGLMVRFLIGNQREITSYMMESQIPALKDSLEELADSAKDISDKLK